MADYGNLTDEQLILLLNENDEKAYTEIYNRYKGLLYTHAYKKLRDQDEADDIIHELFAALWHKRGTIVLKVNLSGYLYVSVRNRILDFISRQQVQSFYLSNLEDFIENGTAVTDYRVRINMLQEQIEKEIDNLPEKMREIFILSRKKHLLNREIAELTGLSQKTVKNQMNNALKILRKRLGLILYVYLLLKYY